MTFTVDRYGDVVLDFEYRPGNDQWDGVDMNPAELLDALRILGVLPVETSPKPPCVCLMPEAGPDECAAHRESPSDRVRESWRKAAAEDMNERAQVNRAIERRRLARERAERLEREREEFRELLAKTHGRRFYRDRDGAVWRTAASDTLILHRHDDGEVPDNPQPSPHVSVESKWGPLTEVPDLFAATRPMPDPRVTERAERRPVLNFLVQAPREETADFVARLRDQVRRDMNNQRV